MEQDNQSNPMEVRDKIIRIIKLKGPSLPIQIGREIQLSSLFAGAFLSELASDKTIKISNMKVGGSPLYFMEGQEPALEKFHNYLPGKEKEAFLLLKQKKILQDSQQEPAIRVALRNIKDFALPVIINIQNNKILFWRFHTTTEQEIKSLLSKSFKSQAKPPMPIAKMKKTMREKTLMQKPLLELKPTKEKQLLELKPTKEKKKKEKSDFVVKIINVLSSEDIEIIEEKEVKKKEYQAVVRINSNIGKIKFLCMAKDKKRVTDNDFVLAEQKAQSQKLPAFFLSPGQPNKKALAHLENSGLIIFKQVS